MSRGVTTISEGVCGAAHGTRSPNLYWPVK